MADANRLEEQRSILSTKPVAPSPVTLTKLVKRIRIMILKLLPVEVDPEAITESTSSIITPAVIEAFAKCGGDFASAVPWSLLKSRASFRKEALNNPADYDECMCRSIACEVLARRIVHNLSMDQLESFLSTRIRFQEPDGDISPPASAIEIAIDQHATIFLSSNEAQHVIQKLWTGDWVQVYSEGDQVDWVPYSKRNSTSFWDHLNPHRLAVPRYQTAFSVIVWFFFLFVYSQAVQTPIDKQNTSRLDIWEVVLYGMAASFFIDNIVKTWKEFQLTSHPLSIINFWTVVDFIIDIILGVALTLRIISIYHPLDDTSQRLHLIGFQVLSTAAPLIWMKVLTVFNGVKIIGVLQVVVFRMIRDSAIFFILLAILALGFAQSLFALDAADGEIESTDIVVNGLLQALLGSPDFDTPNSRFGYPFGLVIYYAWSFLTIIILLNVLIALFGTSYSNVEENATDEFLAFFAFKTIKLIRSPDTYVFVPPFNLIEIVFLIPFERFCTRKFYHRINMFVMSCIFFIPLSIIAIFESLRRSKMNSRFQKYFGEEESDDEDDPEVKDPSCAEGEEGNISKIKFDELVKDFPNTELSASAAVIIEIDKLREKIEHLEKVVGEKRG